MRKLTYLLEMMTTNCFKRKKLYTVKKFRQQQFNEPLNY